MVRGVTQSERGDSADGGLTRGEIHDVLRSDRRRMTIEELKKRDGSATIRDLSEVVAARETEQDPPPEKNRQSVYVSLYQTHVPKLEKLGILEHDQDSHIVSLREAIDEIEVYIEVAPQYCWEFYFGLALCGLLTTIGWVIGVPVLSSLHLSYLIAGYFIFQMAGAAYHVYSHQDRIIFHRLFRR